MNVTTEPGEVSQSTATTPAVAPTAWRRFVDSGRLAVVCSVLGVVGWGGVALVLDPCEQGEQLARFFAALVNLLLMATVGGLATILSVIGLMLSRKAVRQGHRSPGVIERYGGIAALVIGAVVLLFHLPRALMILH
jgi:uncharacterized protein YjeT (DUF2065 family)